MRVAVGALAAILLSLIASRFLLTALDEYRWPVVVYIAIAGAVGYGPVVLWVWWGSHRAGHRSLRADTGLYFRTSDLGWGPLTWLCCLVAQIVLGVIVLVTRIPLTSNTEDVGGAGATRGYVIALAVLAVVAAPLVEEMVFRGVVLRGLLSRMAVWPAVVVQGVVFGMAHFDPARGAGNIGLIIVLSGVGVVLGGAAHRFRRIGPTIIAHAIINAIALTIALTGLAQT